MTLREIQDRLKELLSSRGAVLYVLDGEFMISTPYDQESPVGRGTTIQLAIFNYDERAKKVIGK